MKPKAATRTGRTTHGMFRIGAWGALALLSLSGTTAAQAALQPPSPLADVERALALPRGTDAHDFTEMDGLLYYSAWDVAHGFELWRTDGTADGTMIVADVQPGPVGSMPRHLTAVGNTLFFVANDGTSGFGLWKSDGTAAGTELVKGVEGEFRFPGQLTAFGSLLLFTTGPHRTPRLWRSDGTEKGTEPLRDLWEPGELAGFARPRQPGTVVGGTAYFMARADGRRALWRTDGTVSGTSRVYLSGVLPDPFLYSDLYVAWGGSLLFRGYDATAGDSLWRTDGTPAATWLLAAVPGRHLGADWFTPLGTTLYFGATTGEFARICGLWKTDGTLVGTSTVQTFPGCDVTRLVSTDDKLLFLRNDTDLHMSDGTPGGAQLVARLPGDVLLWSHGGQAYFLGHHTRPTWPPPGYVHPPEFMGTSDGTPAGTQILRDDLRLLRRPLIPTPAMASADPLGRRSAVVAYQGAVYFHAGLATQRRVPEGSRWEELWRSDGTAAGTQPVLSRAGRSRGSWPAEFITTGAAGVFFRNSLTEERDVSARLRVRLLRTDPATGATATVASWPVADGMCSTGFSAPCPQLLHLTAAGGRLFFAQAPWEPHGPFTLWTSDGTAAGTVALHDSYEPAWSGFGAVGGRVVFYDDANDQLWASDGTPGGTLAIGSLSGTLVRADLQFTPVGGTLYFATLAGAQSALYKTDGTPGSVQLVKQAVAGELADVNGTLFFVSNGELWKSDGTSAGTVRVSATRHASRLTAAGARAFFTAWDAARGTELWVSDGTGAGTQLVADVRGGPASSAPDGLTAEGGRVFFTAYNDVYGRELWVSDGTREGTWLVADLRPGPDSALVEGPILAAGGGRVYFPAYGLATGVELWSSGGTPQDTALVQDIAPGAASSSPRELAVIGDRLYFSADGGVHGQEPWTLVLPAPAPGKDGSAGDCLDSRGSRRPTDRDTEGARRWIPQGPRRSRAGDRLHRLASEKR